METEEKQPSGQEPANNNSAGQPDDKGMHDADARRELTAWRMVGTALSLGFAAVFIVSLYRGAITSGVVKVSFWGAFGFGLLISGACLSAGGFLGFIFGIPSLAQTSTNKIKYNDNLVQISDWLTKIIVGVGLTQLTKIPAKVIALGEFLQDNFSGGTWGRNVGLAIVFYFLLLGFLSIYFWTRTDYTRIIKFMDDDLETKLKRAEKEKEEAEQQKAKAEAERQKAEKERLAAEMQKLQAEQERRLAEVAKAQAEEEKERAAEMEQEKMRQQDLQRSEQEEREVLNRYWTTLGISPDAAPAQLPARIVDNDVQNGRFGGMSERNNRKLDARVEESMFPGHYSLTIVVESVDGATLTDDVVLFLHQTFRPSVYIIPKEKFVNGKVIEEVLSYGAFTIGVITDKGNTLLELNLAEVPSLPEDFRKK
jgi:F0F1-type ATP synthase membrane subunit b/b'